MGAGNQGLCVKLHYVVLAVEHPEGSRRLFVLMGWGGPGQDVEGQSWWTERNRELC